MNPKPQVTIIEVGPRDGLQNERAFVDTKTKIAFIDLLSQSGLRHIEATSFVSAKAIPQLADGAQVFRAIQKPSLQFKAQENVHIVSCFIGFNADE